MAATATKPKRTTWAALSVKSDVLDHLNQAEMLTRDQVIARVNALGAPVTRDRLRRWEQDGHLPRPELMGFPARAMYPDFAVPFIAAVPAMLESGLPWSEISKMITIDAMSEQQAEWFQAMTTIPSPELVAAVEEHAKRHERRTGHSVVRVELVMRDDVGHIVGKTMIGWQDFRNPTWSPDLAKKMGMYDDP